MASRKDERERRREERLAAERQAASEARRRLIIGYAAAAILTGAVIAGIVVAVAGSGGGSSSGDFPANAHINLQVGNDNGYKPDGRSGTTPPPIAQADLQKAASEAGCVLHLNLPDEGNTHIPPDSPEPNYHTNPPTSGNHVQTGYQQADGAYLQTPKAIFYVHSLEHGRIEIQYSSHLSESDQLALKGVFDESPGGMLMFPNDGMPFEVAATAWTQLMGCKHYEGAKTLDAIRDFRDTYRGRAPESVPFTP
jgi:hypothetical protein